MERKNPTVGKIVKKYQVKNIKRLPTAHIVYGGISAKPKVFVFLET